uniref:Otopetrin-2-like isoform X2 n=1 Tax=Hirondellea gigas TaxID=1518452 RepID=A0A6A7FU69_9CRUS
MYRDKQRPPPLDFSLKKTHGGRGVLSDLREAHSLPSVDKNDLPNGVKNNDQSRIKRNDNPAHERNMSTGWKQKIQPIRPHKMMTANQLLRQSLEIKDNEELETDILDQKQSPKVHWYGDVRIPEHMSEKDISDRPSLPGIIKRPPLPGNIAQPHTSETAESDLQYPDLLKDYATILSENEYPGNRKQTSIERDSDSEGECLINDIDSSAVLGKRKDNDDLLFNDDAKTTTNHRDLYVSCKDADEKHRCSRSSLAKSEAVDHESSSSTDFENNENSPLMGEVDVVEVVEEVVETMSSTLFRYDDFHPDKNHDSDLEDTHCDYFHKNNSGQVKTPHRTKTIRNPRNRTKTISFPEERDREIEHTRPRSGSVGCDSYSGICLVCNEWVGVHHTPHTNAVPLRANSEGNPGSPCAISLNSPTTPSTPHIVVSSEGYDGEEGPEDGVEDGDETGVGGECASAGDGGEVLTDSTEDLTRVADNNNALDDYETESTMKLQLQNEMSQRARHNSISSYLTPEMDINLNRKTRRNSMIGLIQRASSVNNLNLTPGQQHHLARVASASNLRGSKTSLAPFNNGDWRKQGSDSMIACLSALYGKIIVVMGLAFPIGEFISGEMPLYIYKGFYLCLHIGSILFLLYAYMFLLQVVPLPKVELRAKLQHLKASTLDLRRRLSHSVNLLQQPDTDKARTAPRSADVERGEDSRSFNTLATFQNTKNYTITESTHESMYLKMGAMVFGIGSMIYSGLEVGQYFDLKATPECADILFVISPVSRMIFTFIQMYFIFLNSRVAFNKHRTIARFGVMHMIATNLCIWLNVLVEETKHEIHSLTHSGGYGGHPGKLENYSELYGRGLGEVIAAIVKAAAKNGTTALQHGLAAVAGASDELLDGDHSGEHGGAHFGQDYGSHHLVRRSTTYDDNPSSMYECRQSDMMSRLVDNASPFLFPCTIEYSLLCSGVLYVIWKNINKSDSGHNGNCGDSDISTFIARKARHHYSVDCAHATRGLFMGILVLVLTIISLILFFVLINNEEMKSVAVLEANIIELSVYSVAIVTVVIGMVQMRELEFVQEGDIELDNILLLIAQTGIYLYTSFTIIGGNFSLETERMLPFSTAVITLFQTTLQTLFILNASRRCCYTYDQLTRKPGREMVTFLLICNLAMWAISTFETSRADAHPTQLNYYGVWAWTIISHVSMPLAIFYRFHVTVCLCEIWKRSYKLKHDFL